jgi:CheY-like chemotaxis protein
LSEFSSDQSTATWEILICDDDADLLDLLKHSLSNLELGGKNANIHTATSEKEGLAYIQNNQPFHLFFLDMQMEHEDSGLRITRVIRSNSLYSHSRIILITAQAPDASIRTIVHDFDVNEMMLKTRSTSTQYYIAALTSLRACNALLKLEA